MIIDWSLCQCCGKQAKQRRIPTRKYAGGVLLPDLCDKCYNEITAQFPDGDMAYAEVKRREEEFKKNFVITGFGLSSTNMPSERHLPK
jgi:hypothetical protein